MLSKRRVGVALVSPLGPRRPAPLRLRHRRGFHTHGPPWDIYAQMNGRSSKDRPLALPVLDLGQLPFQTVKRLCRPADPVLRALVAVEEGDLFGVGEGAA